MVKSLALKAVTGFLLALVCFAPALPAQTTVGAFFSFQNAASQSAANGEGTYSLAVSVENFAGTPTFSGTSLIGGGQGSFISSFIAYDASVWTGARSAGWNAKVAGTRTWQVVLNTTGVENLSARFNYRLNGVTANGGSLVTALTAFEYRIGNGPWVSVPGAPLALVNNNSYSNVWSANLGAVTAINNQPEITLRWSLPTFDQFAGDKFGNFDNLQITGLSFGLGRPRILPRGNYNVLFVAFDDLKANFGPFMTPEIREVMPSAVTPNLDSLSATGMAFTRAYCQQAVCWASRASLLTGCRPDTTKNWLDDAKFRDNMPGIITLPQYFANRGYSVAGYGKIFDPRSTPANQDQVLSWPDGFADRGAARTYYEDGKWQHERDTGNNDYATDVGVTNFWVTPNRPVNPNTDYSDGLIATDAINKLNTFATSYVTTGKPFFLAVGFKRPHLPFNAPKNFWDLYDPSKINLAGYTGTRTFPTGTPGFTGANFEITVYNEDIPDKTVNDVNVARQLIHGYLAASSFADYQLGRVLTALNANPTVAANTIIVAWGDHGWHLGDHNGFWSKHSNYEQATRVPLIFRAPGMTTIGTAGKVCDAPVEFVDIYPTLVDLASQPIPPQPSGLEFQGSSLRPLMEDPEQPWKKGAFSQYQRYISGTSRSGDGMGYSIRTKRFRYTEWWRTGVGLDRDVKLFSTPEVVELYDMLNDPKETVNQANNPAFAAYRTELSAALAGGNGWSTPSVEIPSSFPATYASWQASHVEPGYALSHFAATLDPDGDGLVNAREYVHGTNPLSPTSDPTGLEVSGTPGAQFLSLIFPRVATRIDVSLSAKTSTDLINWTTMGVINEIISEEANRTWWRSKVPVGESASEKDFLRLEFVQ